MKHILITIAAVLLVGCGESPKEISIHDVSAAGDIEAVKQHLAAGTDVNAEDHYKSTPLEFAAQGGHRKIVELLIAEGADVNANSKSGTPLHSAAIQDRSEIVELLIDEGADMDWKNMAGYTSWDLALIHGHKETAALLITKGADVNAKNDDGMTPLHFAANKKIAELLIANGAEVNAKKPFLGWSPLHSAISMNRKEIAKLLIAEGADVNAKHEDGATPLHVTATSDLNEIAEMLIAEGVDVNAKDNAGGTPLLRAVFKGNNEIAALLLVNGADVNLKITAWRLFRSAMRSAASGKMTLLDWANRNNRPETAALLRKHGGKTSEELKAEGKLE